MNSTGPLSRRAWIGVWVLLAASIIVLRQCGGEPSVEVARHDPVTSPPHPQEPDSEHRNRAARTPDAPVAAEIAPAADARLAVSIRDLSDGTALPIHSIDAALGEGSARSIEVRGGVAQLTPAEFAGAELRLADPYTVAGRSGSVDSDPTVWCYRSVQIEVHVSFPAELGPDVGARAKATLLVGRPGVLPGLCEPPWSRAWLTEHRLLPLTAALTERVRGVYVGSMPRIRGLAVVVEPLRHAPLAFAPAAARVDIDSSRADAIVELTVSATRTVRGRIRCGVRDPPDWFGGPPPVKISVGQRVPAAGVDVALLGLSGRHGIAAGSVANDVSMMDCTFTTEALAAPDGTFVVPFFQSGMAVVSVDAKGFDLAETSLGQVTESVTGCEVFIHSSGTPTKITLTRGNEPLAGYSVTVVDGSQPIGQTAYGPFSTDATGTFEPQRVTTGREYFLIVRLPTLAADPPANGEFRGWMKWQGQRTIDVTTDLRSRRD